METFEKKSAKKARSICNSSSIVQRIVTHGTRCEYLYRPDNNSATTHCGQPATSGIRPPEAQTGANPAPRDVVTSDQSSNTQSADPVNEVHPDTRSKWWSSIPRRTPADQPPLTLRSVTQQSSRHTPGAMAHPAVRTQARSSAGPTPHGRSTPAAAARSSRPTPPRRRGAAASWRERHPDAARHRPF